MLTFMGSGNGSACPESGTPFSIHWKDIMKNPTVKSTHIFSVVLACLMLPAIAMAQPTWVTNSTWTAGATDATCMNGPSGLQLGDLMLAHVAISSDESIIPPDGWQLILWDEQSLSAVWTGWKLAVQADVDDSGDSAVYCWDWSSDDLDFAGQIRVYRGVDQVNPINADDSDLSDVDNLIATAPSITTTLANTMIVRFLGWEQPVEPGNISPAHSEEWCDSADDQRGITNCGAHKEQGPAGSSGTASWARADTADGWITVTVALAPGDPPTTTERIPTLSQYSLAIMVLLMLGVGLVGFRRSV